MTTFGCYSEDRAERAKVQLDRDLKQVEYYLTDRIGRTVPQAGAITSRLEAARDEVREVVEDLHELIDERTEVPA